MLAAVENREREKSGKIPTDCFHCAPLRKNKIYQSVCLSYAHAVCIVLCISVFILHTILEIFLTEL